MSTHHPLDLDEATAKDMISLATLPYDLLLNIARHLELYDIYSMQQSCRSLHSFAITRPVYRILAHELLRRCRALPLHGFQRLQDLSDEQLIETVNQAARLEKAWLTRGPRPSVHSSYLAHSAHVENGALRWYKIISAPPNEEVDWLSPITSSYSLCATKSGKVVCWDVDHDTCLAEWDPNERWELWKCRVEFDIRTVFFTMAKVLPRSLDDRVMDFVLMKLEFPEDGEPLFSELTAFKTVGIVMNVFLLDPSSRLLSAFVWVSSSNTIGLYTLLDWNKQQYVFIDTGIECAPSANWSCILYKEQIVIHSEDCDIAYQYFYPIEVLRRFSTPYTMDPSAIPTISQRISPISTMSASFLFPSHARSASRASYADAVEGLDGDDAEVLAPPVQGGTVEAGVQAGGNGDSATAADNNPFPYPRWYPESAHFVRQWWPTMPSVPRLSCTVVLLADHDEEDDPRTRYVLAQHYFKVPLVERDEAEQISEEAAKIATDAFRGPVSVNPDRCPDRYGLQALSLGTSVSSSTTSASGEPAWPVPSPHTVRPAPGCESSMMRLWYVSEPFEVVCVLDGPEEEEIDGDDTPQERPRPLMAVDFGHAVWIEYTYPLDEQRDEKRLRFVTFPPVTADRDSAVYASPGDAASGSTGSLGGVVCTLEIPEDLCLDSVETINIDQSQGAIIISVRDGKIFILCYE